MKTEKLFQELGNVDSDLLDAAWEIDDAQKLLAYEKTKRKKQTPWVSVAACAAVLVLTITMTGIPKRPAVTSDPSIPKTQLGGENDLVNLNPPVPEEVINLQINSIDKLNYYAAMRILAGTPAATIQTAVGGSYGISLFTNLSDTDIIEQPPTPDTTGLEETQGPPIQTNPTYPTDPWEDIYYYELDPDQSFYVNKVSMFQIELTDENGFLASKLGLGIVDVVITEDCIWGDSMITFRNGELFFSCLSNGWHRDQETWGCQWDFSTHKYIEGFYIVKNFAQENYSFYVDVDASGQARALECRESQNGGYRADQNVKVVSSTILSNEGGQFTIAELEEYFNNDSVL